MDRADTCFLIAETYKMDMLAQKIPVEEKKQVFCNVFSITRTEFYHAGQSGLSPELKLTVFYGDYNGETIVEFRGKRYSVYRTYTPDEETVELYLVRKVGV